MQRSRVTVEYGYLPGQVFEHERDGVYCVVRDVSGRPPDIPVEQVLEALDLQLSQWRQAGETPRASRLICGSTPIPSASSGPNGSDGMSGPPGCSAAIQTAVTSCSCAPSGSRDRNPAIAALQAMPLGHLPSAPLLPDPHVRQEAATAAPTMPCPPQRRPHIRGHRLFCHGWFPLRQAGLQALAGNEVHGLHRLRFRRRRPATRSRNLTPVTARDTRAYYGHRITLVNVDAQSATLQQRPGRTVRPWPLHRHDQRPVGHAGSSPRRGGGKPWRSGHEPA